jgi:CHASE2 domain-containing sensor protein
VGRIGRSRRFLQLWGAGIVAAAVVTGASAIGWLEPLQVRTLDLIQQLGGQASLPGVAQTPPGSARRLT